MILLPGRELGKEGGIPDYSPNHEPQEIVPISHALIALLEGPGDLISRSIMGTTKLIIWVITVTNLLIKSA